MMLFIHSFSAILFLTCIFFSVKCEKEVKIVDIVTFIGEVYSELEEVMEAVLLNNSTMVQDLRQVEGELDDIVEQEEDEIDLLLALVHRSGHLTPAVRRCITRVTQQAADSKMFADPELEKDCALGEKYWDLLNPIYKELTDIQDPARHLPNDFVSANLWCSINHDVETCYEDVQRQAIENASRMLQVIERAKTADAAVRQHYDLATADCYANTLLKLNQLGAYVKDNVQTCLQ